MDSLEEIEKFWQSDVHEGYDDIVSIKEIAKDDIMMLVNIVNQQKERLEKLYECYPEERQ